MEFPWPSGWPVHRRLDPDRVTQLTWPNPDEAPSSYAFKEKEKSEFVNIRNQPQHDTEFSKNDIPLGPDRLAILSTAMAGRCARARYFAQISLGL